MEEGGEAPRAREVRLLFDDVCTAPAVLTFLWDTRVGRTVPQALRRRGRWTGRRTRRERGMREGQAHPGIVPFLLVPLSSGGFSERGDDFFSFVFPLSFICPSFLFSFVSALECRRPYFGWQQSVVEETGYLEKPHCRCLGSGIINN